jgi:LPXTG-site transpeptidase (sortase) family protein
VFVLIAVVCGSLLLQLVVLSGFQERSAQERAFDQFRAELAKGTAPVAAVDDENRALRPGTPMAYLEIPAIGLRQVVLEGTSSGVLFDGPGHRRDSPFPGAPGTTVLLGRRATFGGPFSQVGDLEEGDAIRVTTGAGEFDYEVIGVRKENEPSPPKLEAGEGRTLLVTADGRPYLPDGVLRVDAQLVSEPLSGGRPAYTSKTLPTSDAVMASDTTTLWALALWLQALLVVTVGFVWAWFRWGRARAWIVGLPVLLLVGLMVADQVARLLPNLL